MEEMSDIQEAFNRAIKELKKPFAKSSQGVFIYKDKIFNDETVFINYIYDDLKKKKEQE